MHSYGVRRRKCSRTPPWYVFVRLRGGGGWRLESCHRSCAPQIVASSCAQAAAVGDLRWPRAINCSGFEGRDGLPSLVAAEPDVPPLDELTRACKAVVAVPVLLFFLF
jgi:hypothetical protein